MRTVHTSRQRGAALPSASTTQSRVIAADLDGVLIAGGASRIPLVTQMLSSHFQRPVIAAGGKSPATALAAGAVLSLGEFPAAAVRQHVQAAGEDGVKRPGAGGTEPQPRSLEVTLPLIVRSSPIIDGTILLALGPGLLEA